MNLQEYQRLTEKVERIKKDIARATGMQDVLLATLKKEFNCDTIEEGEKLLKEMIKKVTSMEEEHQKNMDRFEEQWEDQL